MPKIVFIEPRAPNLHIFSKFTLPRLGPFILGTLMKNRGWEAGIIVEQLASIDFQALKDADLIGLESVKKFLEGRWLALGIAHYARGLNRFWKRRNKTFLKALELLNPEKEAAVSVDYRQRVLLDP
ncbi:MAG TPA: hypothetical protein ENN17_07870 [bacterium]|nr:hypothetical protein [bacterium]